MSREPPFGKLEPPSDDPPPSSHPRPSKLHWKPAGSCCTILAPLMGVYRLALAEMQCCPQGVAVENKESFTSSSSWMGGGSCSRDPGQVAMQVPAAGDPLTVQLTLDHYPRHTLSLFMSRMTPFKRLLEALIFVPDAAGGKKHQTTVVPTCPLCPT